MNSKRKAIPAKVRSKIMILCRGLCCVCHESGVQMHHIDGNHSNSVFDNLAPLCLKCHNHQTITGGFVSRLKPNELKEVRDNFYNIVPSSNSQAQVTQELQQINIKLDKLSRQGESNGI